MMKHKNTTQSHLGTRTNDRQQDGQKRETIYQTKHNQQRQNNEEIPKIKTKKNINEL